MPPVEKKKYMISEARTTGTESWVLRKYRITGGPAKPVLPFSTPDRTPVPSPRAVEGGLPKCGWRHSTSTASASTMPMPARMTLAESEVSSQIPMGLPTSEPATRTQTERQ